VWRWLVAVVVEGRGEADAGCSRWGLHHVEHLCEVGVLVGVAAAAASTLGSVEVIWVEEGRAEHVPVMWVVVMVGGHGTCLLIATVLLL